MPSLASTAATLAPSGDTSGPRMYGLIEKLYPICRSITGDGVRQTLRILAEQIPLTVHEIPSGTQVCDWTVPKEWNIRDAYVKNSQGDRVIDFRQHSLHVVSYSIPVRRRMPFTELKAHLHTLPDHPDWVPYRTSYYTPDWGFCLSHREYLALREETYEVVIDSSLEPGSLTYGELLLPGETPSEVLVSCHICHPSLCNDNLSGIAVAVFLARHLAEVRRRYSYRFVFVPGTIGSLTWLAGHEDGLQNIKHGLVLANLGDRGAFTYKKSRRGDAFVDRAMAQVLRHSGEDYRLVDFSPFGYDERQYCSPGFDLPVGCFMRTPEQTRPEYHTSADDLTFVNSECLAGSLEACKSLVTILERDAVYLNTSPKGEPQLGRRGIYRSMGGPDLETESLALLWMLAYSDGRHALIDIAERSMLPFRTLDKAAATLLEHGLLTPFAAGRASATQEYAGLI
jgi:aminopeptidase-like protein